MECQDELNNLKSDLRREGKILKSINENTNESVLRISAIQEELRRR